MLDQFTNPANPGIHRRKTAVELWEDTGGNIDVFVSAVGTGGTLTGIGGYLKERNPRIRVVAVEPEGAAVLSGRPAGDHKMPGIGVGFVPPVLDRGLIDEVIAVGDDEAFEYARLLARKVGILAGASSGAALFAARTVAARKESGHKVVAVLLADTGERYITTSRFVG